MCRNQSQAPGPSALDCKLGFISAMLAVQGTPRAVAPTPRAPVHPTLRMVRGAFYLRVLL